MISFTIGTGTDRVPEQTEGRSLWWYRRHAYSVGTNRSAVSRRPQT